MEHWYHAHGLVIASELELPLPSSEAVARPDLRLRLGPERDVPAVRPSGTQIAELAANDGFFYSFGREGDRILLRYPGLCDFAGDAGLTEVTAHPHTGIDPELAAVLAAGTLLAVHLVLHERLVLHASAVRRNGHAVAFVGASGMGKSTLAAALCGIGWDLVADDVLRVDLSTDGARVHPGSTECRLRPNAHALADGAATRLTADGRLAVRASTTVNGALPLGACVVPLPSRSVTEVSVERLPAGQAIRRLLQFPRVVGWSEPAGLAHTFQGLAGLVEVVPVFQARIPWGPPFPAGVLTNLVDAVE